MINTYSILEKQTHHFEIGLEQSVAFAFNFTELPHPLKAVERYTYDANGEETIDFDKYCNELQQNRNDYFDNVLEQCNNPAPHKPKLLRTIFCKMLNQLESVLAYKTFETDKEPEKQSWIVAQKFWQSIQHELKTYDPYNE